MTTPVVNKLYLWTDSNSRQTFAIDFPTYVDFYVLAAGVAQTITFPTGANAPNFVLFSCDQNFYTNANGTAAVPGSTTTGGAQSELNPTIRRIPPGLASVSVVSPATTANLSVAYYQ